MEWFERRCRSGRSSRNPSAGSWCGTSNRLADLLLWGTLLCLNLDGRILVRSLGRIVQNHRQTHARFRKGRFRGPGGVALIGSSDGQMLVEHALSHVIAVRAALQF